MRPSLRLALTIALVAVVAEASALAISARIPSPRVFANYTIQRQVAAISERGQVDVVFMGTSLVGAGVDPILVSQELPGEPSVFNAAVGGGGPLLLQHWASDLVIPSLEPQLVVIGIGPRDSNDNFAGPARTEDDYLSSKGRERLLGQSDWFGRADAALERNVGLFRLRTAYREPASAAAFLRNGSGSWRRATDDNGRIVFFEDRQFVLDEDPDPPAPGEPLANYAVGGRNMTAVSEVIDVLQQSGIEVVLVDMPRVEASLEQAVGVDGIDAYEEALGELAREHDVVLFQGDSWVSDIAFFADQHHLNADGTRAFSNALARALVAR